MKDEKRTLIKSKALRAAAKVALMGSSMSCGVADGTSLEVKDVGPPPSAHQAEPMHDAEAPAEAGTPPDAGTLMAIDAGESVDATIIVCSATEMTEEEFRACCAAVGWDWRRGCTAWGPPAPPVMPLEVA